MKSEHRIAEIDGKFYPETRIGLGWPFMKKKWVRLDYQGNPILPYSSHSAGRPSPVRISFDTLKQARDWVRIPKVKTSVVYHKP